PPVVPDPLKSTTGIGMPLADTGLSESCTGMRPEIARPQLDRARHELAGNPSRLIAASYRPIEKTKRASEAQDMGGTFRPPLALATIKRVLTHMRELPEVREDLRRVGREIDNLRCERLAFGVGQIDQAHERLLKLRLDLCRQIG